MNPEEKLERYDGDVCEPEPRKIGAYIECSECGGEGRDMSAMDDVNCRECNGAGVIFI